MRRLQAQFSLYVSPSFPQHVVSSVLYVSPSFPQHVVSSCRSRAPPESDYRQLPSGFRYISWQQIFILISRHAIVTLLSCSGRTVVTPFSCSQQAVVTPLSCSLQDVVTPFSCPLQAVVTPFSCSRRVSHPALPARGNMCNLYT